MIMMETKRCPACSRSLLDMCPTCSRSLSVKPSGLDEEDGKERKKIVTEDGEGKRSREEGKRCSSGLNKKKKAKSEAKEGSGSKKKDKRLSEMEGSRPKEAETEGSGLKETKMEIGELARINGKTKMVTRRLDKISIDTILRFCPPSKPYTCDCDTLSPFLEDMFASDIRQYEVYCEFHEYLRRQSIIRGYAEYQIEVIDDEEE